MYHINGTEVLELVGLRLPGKEDRIVYTISIEGTRTIYHDNAPILFVKKEMGRRARLTANCGAEKLKKYNSRRCCVYDFRTFLKDLRDKRKRYLKNNDLLNCLMLLLDYYHDIKTFPKEIFLTQDVCEDPKDHQKYKVKKITKENVQKEYQTFKILFDAEDCFFSCHDYKQYCQQCHSTCEDLARAMEEVLNEFIDNALWIT